jgi:hypothetical protein
MSAYNNLAASGASPANTYDQLLHIGTGTPGNAVVRTGDGTATALTLVPGGISVAGQVAATTMAVTGALSAASLMVDGVPIGGGGGGGGGPGDTGGGSGATPVIGVPIFRRVASDLTNSSSSSFTAISAFSYTPVIGAIYEVKMQLLLVSAALSTGIALNNSGGSFTGVFQDSQYSRFLFPGAVSVWADAGSVSPNRYSLILDAIITALSADPITFSFRSEINGSQITVFASSYIRYTRLNP